MPSGACFKVRKGQRSVLNSSKKIDLLHQSPWVLPAGGNPRTNVSSPGAPAPSPAAPRAATRAPRHNPRPFYADPKFSKTKLNELLFPSV